MMNTTLLNNKFARIGARVKFQNLKQNRSQPQETSISLDIGTDRRGEFFEVKQRAPVEFQVLDLQPDDRHLLLMVRDDEDKSKFLCGHDERHWFVAGIPEAASVGNVVQAKEALKPRAVRMAQSIRRVKSKARNRRKNAAFVRQGEWFFLPQEGMQIPDELVLRNEPLRRDNGSKPHWAQFCYRRGGETVYVNDRIPDGISEARYRRILTRNKKARKWNWRPMQRNPVVYVKGRIQHPDHKVLKLKCWHRVIMNTEHESDAMSSVAFLD